MGLFGKKKPAADDDVTISFVWSKNMQLRVAAPQGHGWQRMEAGEHADGLLAAVKCIHGTPPAALALDAYVYRSDPVPTLEQLKARDWEKHFADKMFASVDAVALRSVRHAARSGGFQDEGVEIEVMGKLREPSMLVTLRERHVPVSGKLLVVSAAGSPAEHQRLAKLVDSWMAHAMLGGE